MAERRALVEGLKNSPPAVPTARESEFVYGKQSAPKPEPQPQTVAKSTSSASPISTRLRTDYAEGLKHASLDRQLKGIKPNTMRDILEECVGPWLRENGYLT
jgi:hypothetical protein